MIVHKDLLGLAYFAPSPMSIALWFMAWPIWLKLNP